jgi:hypothetical protein
MVKTRIPQFTKDLIPTGKVQSDNPFPKPRLKKRVILRQRSPKMKMLEETELLKKKLAVPERDADDVIY